MQSFLLLLPDFALIAVGALLRRFFGLGDGFWPDVEKLVYFVLFPALLFQALARSSVDVSAMGPLLAVGLLTMAGGLLLGLAGRRLIGLDAIAFASRLQCAYRFNTYIGIAVAGKLAGAAGVAAMGALCGAMVPFANMAAVGMMARHGQGRLLRELLRNPLIIATVLGLAANLLGLGLPAWAGTTLSRIGSASIALGLMAAGAGMQLQSLARAKALGISVLTIRHLLQPLTAWLLARAFGLGTAEATALLVFSALPTSSSGYVLAARMGYNGAYVAGLVTLSTLLALLSLPWAFLLLERLAP